MNNIEKMWTKRYTEELNSIGVLVPEGTSYADLKALHKQHAKEMPKKESKPKPKAAPSAPQAPVMDEAAMMAAIDKYMQSLAQPKEATAPGSNMDEGQMVRIMRAVNESSHGKSGLNPNYVDPTDQMPKVRLFAPYGYFFIRGKEVAGYPVALPNNLKVIAFTPDFPKTILSGGKGKRQYSCYADITSHSLFKWITGKDIHGNDVGVPHSEFRVKYFIDPQEMITDGFAIWERLYYGHRTFLETRSLSELISLGQTEAGITPSSHNDKGVLASHIAKFRANKEFEKAKAANQTVREQSASLASTMFGQATTPMPLPV